MRGVCTSVVLEAFDEAGRRFDSVVACSAGASAGGSYLAGQTWRNRRVYLDDLTDGVTRRSCPLDLNALPVKRTTTDRALLEQGCDLGKRDGEAFGRPLRLFLMHADACA